MLTAKEFREDFPQFTEALFSDRQVVFYLTLAEKSTSSERWGDLWREGCFLHAAHHLTLMKVATKNADGTGGMDASAGATIATSKTIGGVSISETRAGTAATLNLNAGHYNDTTYGKQYWQMAQLMGAGGLYI